MRARRMSDLGVGLAAVDVVVVGVVGGNDSTAGIVGPLKS